MTWKARVLAARVAPVLLSFLATPPTFAQSGTVTYTYDSLGRVLDAAYPDGTCLAYSYDAAGNRTQYTSSTVVGVVAPAVAITAHTSLASTFDPRVGNPTCGALTVSAVGTPSHGTATIVSGGTGIVYTPTSGFTGTDSFTYQVTSGGVSSPNGTVTVTIAAPTLAPTALIGAGYFTAIVPPGAYPVATTNVTSLVSDPYGYVPTISSVTQGTHGTVTYSGNVLTYTYPGPVNNEKMIGDTYTYTVTDGHGNSATATIYVTIQILDYH